MLEKIGKKLSLKPTRNVQRVMETTQKRQHCDGWMCIGKWYMLFIYLVWLFDRTVSESALLFIYIQSSLLVWNPVFSNPRTKYIQRAHLTSLEKWTALVNLICFNCLTLYFGINTFEWSLKPHISLEIMLDYK